MNTGYTNIIEVQTISNEVPFAPIPDVKFCRNIDSNGFRAFFQDPKDVYINGQLSTKREKTLIVAKKGAPPESHLDGEYVYTHTGHHDTPKWLEFISPYSDFSDAGMRLYVQLFAVSTSGNVYPITRVYKLYTYLYLIDIDPTNPNPDTRVTAPLDGGDMVVVPQPATPAEWESIEPFKSIRPCLFKDGKVQYYLNKEDFTKKEDGSPSDITSGADGDVMIEFPNVYLIVGTEDVIISGLPLSSESFLDEEVPTIGPLEGFDSLDNFYVSAYLGCEKQGKLRSLVDRSHVRVPRGDAEPLVKQKGERYDLFPFWTLNVIQALFLLKYKTSNSEVIGYGHISPSAGSRWTGSTKSAPMDSGTTENINQDVKLFGIEGLWGMCRSWTSGIKLETTSSFRVDSNRDGSSFELVPWDGIGHLGYMKNFGGDFLGFIPVSPMSSGSESTYFCDFFRGLGTGENIHDHPFFAPGEFFIDEGKKRCGLFASGFLYKSNPLAVRFVYY